MNAPLVSVVIPVWNSERFLLRTIESVRKQTFRDWELVVIDDGSTDRSAEIARRAAEEEPRLRVVVQANAGVGPARNAGYAATNPASSYLIFLDHDDCWEPDALESLVAALESHPTAPAAYGLSRAIDAGGNVTETRVEDSWGFQRMGLRNGRGVEAARDAPTTFDMLAIWPCFETPGQMLMRRKALERAEEPQGLFDQSVRGSDEWELALRLSLQGPIVRVLKFVIQKRAHDANAFNIPGYMAKAHNIRHKLATAPVYAAQRDVAKQANLVAIKFQFAWVARSLRRLQLKRALGQTVRAVGAYVQHVQTHR